MRHPKEQVEVRSMPTQEQQVAELWRRWYVRWLRGSRWVALRTLHREACFWARRSGLPEPSPSDVVLALRSYGAREDTYKREFLVRLRRLQRGGAGR